MLLTTKCANASGACQNDAFCSGLSAFCPSKTFKTSECNTSSGPCETSGVCSSSSINCPSKTLRPAGFVCTNASTTCETDGLCSGLATSCPAKVFKPASAGSYCPSGALVNARTCPSGSYCPAGATAPTACNAGTFNILAGQSASSSCLVCTGGYYCVSNCSSPVSCPPGFYCPAGSSSATENPCPVGTFKAASGGASSQSCDACPAGRYCPVQNLTNSIICPARSYCPRASTSPIVCSPTMSCPIGSGAPGTCDQYGKVVNYECTYLCFCVSLGVLVPILVGASCGLLACVFWHVWTSVKATKFNDLVEKWQDIRWAWLFYVLISWGDLMSDIAYVSRSTFRNEALQYISVIFVVIQVVPAVIVLRPDWGHLKQPVRFYTPLGDDASSFFRVLGNLLITLVAVTGYVLVAVPLGFLLCVLMYSSKLHSSYWRSRSVGGAFGTPRC